MHALLNELNEVISECSDPGVARIKFKWWRDEIERWSGQQPRHPVTRELQSNITADEELMNSINLAVNGFERLINIEQPDSLDAILSLFESSSGKLWSLCYRLLGHPNQDRYKAIESTGALIQFIGCLQQPDRFINETRLIIPADFSGAGDILELKSNPAESETRLNEIFKPLILDLIDRLNGLYQGYVHDNHPALQHVLILNRLTLKLCREIQLDGNRLLHNKISLTPIRKLWVAWYTHLLFNYFR